MRPNPVVLLLALLLAVPAAAQADDPATTLAGKAGEAGSHSCRFAGAPTETCNSIPVGSHPSSAAVDAYQGSWTQRALTDQYALANDVSLANAPWVGTHNSFNSLAYGYSPSRSDSNQQLTLTDQLRIDVRSVELDVHWVNGQPLVCHGTEQHAGCTTEGPLGPYLDEIAAFLARPGNGAQVVLLYLEDQIQNTTGYDTVAAELERAFGAKLFRSAGGACSPKLPLTISRDDVLAAGAQVVTVASGCGGGTSAGGATPWSRMVFDWSGNVHSEARPRGYRDYPDCGPDFTRAEYDSRIIRYFEDSTFVTSAGSTAGAAQPDDGLTPQTTAAMMRCGVDLTGFDQLLPDDGRLEASVWSWAPGQPGAGECAVERRADARWESTSCSGPRPAACRTAAGNWLVTKTPVTVRNAPDACAARAAAFDVPRTGYEGQRLRDAIPPRYDAVWLGYRRTTAGWAATTPR